MPNTLEGGTEPIASVTNLRKRYNEVEAVRSLTFDLRPGEIFGLLGPNGAGKTTAIEIMEGLRNYDGGTVRVLGLDPWRQSLHLKQRIGAALQNTVLPDKLRVAEALRFYAGFYDHHADINALLDRFDLQSKRHAYYDTLSGGQKQRLALALCLVNNPDLVFLDEPTAGLDAQVRRDLHEIILNLRAEGKTVLLTTHYIEEAEQLCDRVAIIAHGEMKAIGSPAGLRTKATNLSRVDAGFTPEIPLDALAGLSTTVRLERQPGGVTIHTSEPAAAVAGLVRALDAAGATLERIAILHPTLEDLYLELTGGEEQPA